MWKKNDTARVVCGNMTTEGMGVAKLEGYTVFVPMAVDGEEADVRIVKVNPTYGFAKLEKLHTISADRCDAECAVYEQCGGCSLRHITYQKELALKETEVYETLRRIGHLDMSNIEKLPIIGSAETRGYRNKAQYPVQRDAQGNVRIGFFAKRTHRVIDCDDCQLQPALFAQVTEIVRAFLSSYNISIYNEETHKGLVRHLYIRYGEMKQQLMVCLVINGTKLEHQEVLITALKVFPSFQSFVLNSNTEKGNVILQRACQTLFGSDDIEDVLLEQIYRFSPLSFYQVNRATCETLYKVAAEFAQVTQSDTLLDLYCGVGTIGLSMAKHAKLLIGVEIVASAIENAKYNAQVNGIENASFICDDAKGAAQYLLAKNLAPDVVILDPPRKGLDEEVIACVAKMNPSRIVIVSCNVSTLARDLQVFSQLGYASMKIQPVDMFPRTAHVECVVLMSRVKE